MYTLKSLVRRGMAFGGAAALVVAAVAPLATPAFADALNPLTERSLTLSSSSPGWDYLDGSGNTTYAPPNSGANGQKTGETFSFRVSTDTTTSKLKAMTLQYCTTSAGDCLSPGDNGWESGARKSDSATTSDLNVVTSSPSEVASGDFGTYVDTATGATKAVPAQAVSGSNFVVYSSTDGTTWNQSNGWTMTASNNETGDVASSTATGANNFITLKNTAGDGFAFNEQVKVVFFGTDTNYITNPGSGAFFVKINTYSDEAATNLVDGGVTVANVMNHSIQITTKVLETMQFSVGTVDPDTLDSTGGATSELYEANGNESHNTCDTILRGMKPSDPVNLLELGNQAAESSLDTEHTYSTHSYWRLSSNSSAGATVYYSGVTLKNTSGDEIEAIGDAKKAPAVGAEQFGLAIDNSKSGNYQVDYDVETDPTKGVFENGADNTTNGYHATTATDNAGKLSHHVPQLAPLVASGTYSDGAGVVNGGTGEYGTVNTKFAFEPSSNTIPVAIASENSEVVDCVTAKMRYIANIAATTPAGIYTTKINYIAAPQY